MVFVWQVLGTRKKWLAKKSMLLNKASGNLVNHILSSWIFTKPIVCTKVKGCNAWTSCLMCRFNPKQSNSRRTEVVVHLYAYRFKFCVIFFNRRSLSFLEGKPGGSSKWDSTNQIELHGVNFSNKFFGHYYASLKSIQCCTIEIKWCNSNPLIFQGIVKLKKFIDLKYPLY